MLRQGVFSVEICRNLEYYGIGFQCEEREEKMDYASIIELGDYLNTFKIPNIPDDTNFWLIRSKGGYFYNEFISQKFVALGWNYITKDSVLTT